MVSIVVFLCNFFKTCCLHCNVNCLRVILFVCSFACCEFVVSVFSSCFPNIDSLSCVVNICSCFVIVDSDLSIIVVNKTFAQSIDVLKSLKSCCFTCDVRKFGFQHETKSIAFAGCCSCVPLVICCLLIFC